MFLFQIKMDKDEYVDPNTVEGVKKRQPKRVIHCSDGIIEEYSSEEETEVSYLVRRQPSPK